MLRPGGCIQEQRWVGGELKPAPDVLARWAKTVQELLKTTAMRDDQVRKTEFVSMYAGCSSLPAFMLLFWPALSFMRLCLFVGPQFNGYIGRMAFSVRTAVVQHLKEAKLLPANHMTRDQLELPMQLHRIAQPLLGREAEVQQVTNMEHHAAVIWGGPGEGKSSIAMEAGCRLWDADKCLGGCFAIDCIGALHSTVDTPRPLPYLKRCTD